MEVVLRGLPSLPDGACSQGCVVWGQAIAGTVCTLPCCVHGWYFECGSPQQALEQSTGGVVLFAAVRQHWLQTVSRVEVCMGHRTSGISYSMHMLAGRPQLGPGSGSGSGRAIKAMAGWIVWCACDQGSTWRTVDILQ
jgi:hypothetical protein